VWCAPERNHTLVWKPAQDCGGINIFSHDRCRLFTKDQIVNNSTILPNVSPVV
jgi:hypothetical protein